MANKSLDEDKWEATSAGVNAYFKYLYGAPTGTQLDLHPLLLYNLTSSRLPRTTNTYVYMYFRGNIVVILLCISVYPSHIPCQLTTLASCLRALSSWRSARFILYSSKTIKDDSPFTTTKHTAVESVQWCKVNAGKILSLNVFQKTIRVQMPVYS